MAMVFRCVRNYRHRDSGDWAKKAIVGDGRRRDWNPENVSVAAGVGQRPTGRSEISRWPEPPPAVALRRSAQSGHLEPGLPLSPNRYHPSWGAAEERGLLSLALTVPQLYRTQQTSDHVSPGKQSPSVAGSMTFLLDSEPCSGARALINTELYKMRVKGLASIGSRLSCRALFSHRRNDSCHHRFWSFRTFKWLIVTNTHASPQDGNRYWHSVIKVLHQCRTYSYFKDGNRYSNRNNAVPPPQSKTVYYDILKISPNATQSQIKSAYYKQSLLYHPDRNAGSEEAALRFTQINEAYSVLGTVSLRKKYDRGILTPADLHSEKKSLEKAQASKTKQSQARSSSDHLDTGKSMFNFDEFYRAHYGEQLAREQTQRWRRMQLHKNKESQEKKWHFHRLIEVAVTAMLMAGFYLLFNIKNK
ncbi:uncharacterized protein LOC144684557 [Cetorhinus maximus]